jgi:hypothetical protein
MFAEMLTLFLATPVPPAGTCRWATTADMAGLRVRRGQEEPTETQSLKRHPPEDDGLAHSFPVEVTREARGPKCLFVRWRAVPRGRPAASAADFFGSRWPSGMIELPAWPTPRDVNPPMVEIRFSPRDDGIAEPNETLGVELLDRNGRIMWGIETWAPQIIGRTVIWNNDDHRNGITLTIHDAGHSCSIPGPGSGFLIINRRANAEDRPHFAWPGIFVERPDRPIVQCETLRWRLAPGRGKSLRATDFPKDAFPSGTLRFNSLATGGPDEQEDALPIQFALRKGVPRSRRTVKVILESARGIVAQSTVTLE